MYIVLPADGQSIAIRLAKQISSTTDNSYLFIAHTRDEQEGRVYHLPPSFLWQDVITNTIELSTYPGIVRDTSLINKVIRAYNMK